MKSWKQALREDETANIVAAPVTGTKRKAVSILSPGPIRTAVPDHGPGRALPDRGICVAQDVSVDEAEIRSKYDAGALAKVSPAFQFCAPLVDPTAIFPYWASRPGSPYCSLLSSAIGHPC